MFFGIGTHLDEIAPLWRERDLSKGTRLLSVRQRERTKKTRWAADLSYYTMSGQERVSNNPEKKKSLHMNMEISNKEPRSQLPGWVQEFRNQHSVTWLGKRGQSDPGKKCKHFLGHSPLGSSRWQPNSLAKLKGSMHSFFWWKTPQFLLSFQSVPWLHPEDTRVGRAEKRFFIFYFYVWQWLQRVAIKPATEPLPDCMM